MTKDFNEMTFEELSEYMKQEGGLPQEEKEEKQEEDVKPEPEAKEEEAPVEESKEEEPKKEEPKTETQGAEDEKIDNAAWAKHRRELKAERERAERLAAELEEYKRKQQQASDPAPEEQEPAERLHRIEKTLQEIEAERIINAATQRFNELEIEFKRDVPDYDAVCAAYLKSAILAAKIDNPRESDARIGEIVRNKTLVKAMRYAEAGYNPVEAIYNEALSLGLKPQQQEKFTPAPSREKPKPDLSQVDRNRKRSAAFSGGQVGGGDVDVHRALYEMSNEEFMNMNKAQKNQVLRQMGAF